MRLISYDSQSLYLLDTPPDWAMPFRAKASLLSEFESGLTEREGRRALGETLRLRLEFKIKVVGAEARALAAALRAYRDEPVAVPLWPVACLWADRAGAQFTGGLNYLLPAAGGEPVIFGAVEPEGIQPGDTLVPLVVGNLDARIIDWITDELAGYVVTLVENSPAAWAIVPAAYTAPAGPKPAAYATAPRLFPFPTHWDEPRTACNVRIEREAIGFGRQTIDTLRAGSPVARAVEQSVKAMAGEGWGAGQLVRFFLDHGHGKAFWAAGVGAAGRLHADLPANCTGLLLEGAEPYLVGDYLAMLQGGRLVAGFGPIAASGSAHFYKLIESGGLLIAWSDGSIALAE